MAGENEGGRMIFTGLVEGRSVLAGGIKISWSSSIKTVTFSLACRTEGLTRNRLRGFSTAAPSKRFQQLLSSAPEQLSTEAALYHKPWRAQKVPIKKGCDNADISVAGPGNTNLAGER